MDGEDKRNDQGWPEIESWIVEINEEVSKQTESKMNTQGAIYRRPVNALEKPDSFVYTPRIVSFGPYHHDSEYCQRTNKIKKCALIRFLKRSTKKIDEYVKVLWEDVEYLRGEYNQLDPKWQHDDAGFFQMMILDGCFFLEILLEAKETKDEQGHLGYYSRPLLIKQGISPIESAEYSRHDMLLLENQLPMKLLVKLVATQNDESDEDARRYLYDLALSFLAPSLPNNTRNMLTDDLEQDYVHVLDLYRGSFLYRHRIERDALYFFKQKWYLLLDLCPSSPIRAFIICILMVLGLLISLLVILPTFVIAALICHAIHTLIHSLKTAQTPNIRFIIPSATELRKLGIGLKLKRNNSLSDISFGGRHLKLPQVYINSASESSFLNILAFEQLYPGAKNEVTSYIFWMSRLLQVADDVRLLQLRGILHTTLPGDEVVKLFKRLIKDVPHDPGAFFSHGQKEAAKGLTMRFYKRMNSPWRRDLWETYLKSPWTVISIIAAFFLFALSAIQAVYSILAYHKPR